MASPVECSVEFHGCNTRSPRTFKDFDMGDPIFPTDLGYLLETSDVESFKGFDVFPIFCPGLTTV